MKKTKKIIFAIVLTLFSFYYTDKIVEIAKSKDVIMMQINSKANEVVLDKVDAVINENYVIPGKSSLKIDVNKSYEKMKRLGEYNENLLVFFNDFPEISINNIYDKYINCGNGERRQVSLLFIIDDIKYFDDILKISKNNNIKPTFFIDSNFIYTYKNKISNNINYFYLENYGYDGYDDKKISYANNIIKDVTGSNSKYCLLFEENGDILNICKKKKMHTIIPSIVSSINAYSDIVFNLENSKMYYVEVNNKVILELDSIIKYILGKGYEIVSLNDLLIE